MPAIKVQPWGEGQGDFVLIDDSEFNPEFHTLLDGEAIPTRVLLIDSGSSSINIGAFRAELESVGLIVESFADQDLMRPEGELGPIADRLFQVFVAVNAGVESLILERDGEAEKVKILQRQVGDLLQQVDKAGRDDAEAKEVADLKAKLDEAKVPYRANASKESLKKQVDELSKA